MELSHLCADELELIRTAFLFRGQEETCVRACLESENCTLEVFSKGAQVYTPEVFRRSLGILLSGRLRVTKGALVVNQLRPGELFGAAALFAEGEPYAATLTAQSPCRVVFLEQGLVRRALDTCPALAANYILYLSQRIHFLNGKLDGLLATGATEKLTRYLLEQTGGSGELECPAAELARRLDVGRASLYRAFHELEERGDLVRNGKYMTVSLTTRNTQEE